MRAIKPLFGTFFGTAAAALAALCILIAPASAQQDIKVPEKTSAGSETWHALPPGGPAPRTADGHPDLAGVWFPNSAGRQIQSAYPIDRAARRQFDPAVTPEEKPALIPEAEAKLKRPVPYGQCVIPSTPGTLLQENSLTWPIQLVEGQGRIVMMIEYPMDFRIIHTDGRPHPKDPDPTFNGDSVAHWDGDTLVIDTISLDERAPDWGGWFHSDREHVVERISRPSKNYLVYQVTIEDPVVLQKPWVSAPRKWSLSVVPDDDLEEFFCTTNEEPQEWQSQGRPDPNAFQRPPRNR